MFYINLDLRALDIKYTIIVTAAQVLVRMDSYITNYTIHVNSVYTYLLTLHSACILHMSGFCFRMQKRTERDVDIDLSFSNNQIAMTVDESIRVKVRFQAKFGETYNVGRRHLVLCPINLCRLNFVDINTHSNIYTNFYPIKQFVLNRIKILKLSKICI